MKTLIATFTAAGLLAAAGCTAEQPGATDTEGAASCREIVDADPTAADGEYILYVEGDRGRPWQAYCHDMAGQPREYLTLTAEGADRNQSRLRVYDGRGYSAVTTRYERVRIDPRQLDVDIGDQTFATSEGGAEAGNTTVRSMPFGVAAACSTQPEVALIARSSIDLGGTPFILESGFCLRDAAPAVSNTWSSAQRRVELMVAPGEPGTCASASVAPCPGGLYNEAGGFQLRLAYQP